MVRGEESSECSGTVPMMGNPARANSGQRFNNGIADFLHRLPQRLRRMIDDATENIACP